MIEILDYDPSMNEECLELERACPQGRAFRLSFARRAFHARSESYDRWKIWVARSGGIAVGATAAAFKSVSIRGARESAAFFYDLRVRPDFRGLGIGKHLMARAEEEADRVGASVRYGYTVADNRAALALGQLFGGRISGHYRYLVWPVYKRRRVAVPPREATAATVHAAHLEAARPYDWYSNPLEGGRLQGHVGAWLGESAGCSAWSNSGLLEETVESIPFYYSWIRSAFRAWPLRAKALPHIPVRGEVLRSWYIYDFHATGAESALELMSHVNNVALERGIRFCHVVVADRSEPWFPALRAANPAIFSPVIPYCLGMKRVDGKIMEFQRPYIDIRDL